MGPTILSLGNIAADLQRTPYEISKVAEQLGVEPALTINRIQHLAEPDVVRIAEHFRAVERASASDTPPAVSH